MYNGGEVRTSFGLLPGKYDRQADMELMDEKVK